jgi:hypothetical protein
MFQGTHPLTDHAGKPWPTDSLGFRLAGLPLQRRGIVYKLVGDLEQFSLGFGLQHYNSKEP